MSKIVEIKLKKLYNIYKGSEFYLEQIKPIGINLRINASRVWKGILSRSFVNTQGIVVYISLLKRKDGFYANIV